MTRAVLRNGAIVPIDPIPSEWQEGQELWVGEADPKSIESIDEWARQLNAMCAENDPEDLMLVEEELRKADELAKAMVRREMGLS